VGTEESKLDSDDEEAPIPQLHFKRVTEIPVLSKFAKPFIHHDFPEPTATGEDGEEEEK